jgi:hypothetical protein
LGHKCVFACSDDDGLAGWLHHVSRGAVDTLPPQGVTALKCERSSKDVAMQHASARPFHERFDSFGRSVGSP